jgi:hypothetical protein
VLRSTLLEPRKERPVQTGLGKKRSDSPKPRRTYLTPTGLLMEGHSAH